MGWQEIPSWVVAFFVSFLVCGLLVIGGPRDAPTSDRKDQKRPIPTSGGIGIAIGFAVAIGFQVSASTFQFNMACATNLAIMSGFLLVGFVDDLLDISAILKMLFLGGLSLGACLLGWYWFFGGANGSETLLISLPFILGGALWIFVFVNAANFMDGSNGLSLGSMVIMLIASGALHAGHVVLISAIIAFLIWNLSGRLFAGDSGALFVGYIVSASALQGAYELNYSVWIPPLIALPFLTDVILTVIWRARRGGNVMQAHREHAYQLLRRAGWGHLPVALLWWAMTAVCGVVAVLAANAFDWRGEMATFLVVLAVSIALWVWQRRTYWLRVSAPG